MVTRKTINTLLAITLIWSIAEWGLQAIYYTGQKVFEPIYHYTRLGIEIIFVYFVSTRSNGVLRTISYLALISLFSRLFYRLYKHLGGEPFHTAQPVFWVGLLIGIIFVIINYILNWKQS